jgi:hypothetical protein
MQNVPKGVKPNAAKERNANGQNAGRESAKAM